MNKKFKFIILGLALMLSFGLVLSGCGTADKAAKSNEPVTLDFVWFSDGEEGKIVQQLAKEYEKTHANVKINFIEVPFKDFNTKMKTMIAGGKPPALARVATADVGNYYKQAIDLGDAGGGTDAFAGQFMDSLKPYYVIGGKALAAPMDVTANALIYNKTLFKKAGVEVPSSPDKVWTWAELEVAAKQVMDKGDAAYGLVWDFSPHRWSTILYEYNGSVFNEDGTKSVINNEQGAAALNQFVKLHKEKIIPESVWLGGENPNNLFRSGKVAMHLAGSWMLGNYKDIKDFEWGVTYLPKGTNRSSVPGGKLLMGFKGTKAEKETAEFIQYLVSKDINSKYCQEALFISPRKDSADLNYAYGKEMFKIFSDELQATPAKSSNDWARSEVMSKFTTDYKDNIVAAVQGKLTVQQALDNIQTKAEKAIKDVANK